MAHKILILGSYRQSITVVRSLARAGYPVVVGSHEKAFTEYSRYTSEVWRHPPIEPDGDVDGEPDGGAALHEAVRTTFTRALAGFLARRPDIALVFPVGEDVLACLARCPDAVAAAAPVMPAPEVVLACLDKARMYELIDQLAIPMARHGLARDPAAVGALADEVGYPCVIKPKDSLRPFFAQKAVICRHAGDVDQAVRPWPAGNDVLIVQAFAAGHRHNCHFAALDGSLRMYFEQRVLRTNRLDATGFGVDGVSVRPSAVLRAYCEQLIGALGYSGVGCIQFLVDEHGRASFLELNPRLDATCALPYHCGHDFPRMAVALAERRRGARVPLPEPSATYPVGRRVDWLLGDLQGLVHASRQGEADLAQSLCWLGQMGRAWLEADCHVTWSVADPLPSAYLSATWLGAMAGRRVRALARRARRRPR